jgi:selT/selW/selH-like putative selenoprotein
VERELRREFDDIEIELAEGEHGDFDIYLDDKLIFSKQAGSCCQDRFPRPREIPEIIRRLT